MKFEVFDLVPEQAFGNGVTRLIYVNPECVEALEDVFEWADAVGGTNQPQEVPNPGPHAMGRTQGVTRMCLAHSKRGIVVLGEIDDVAKQLDPTLDAR